MTITEWVALRTLLALGVGRHAGLVDVLGMTKGVASKVISQLVAAGVESCHVEYRCGRASDFLPDGESLDLAIDQPAKVIADAFDGDGVRAAIRGRSKAA